MRQMKQPRESEGRQSVQFINRRSLGRTSVSFGLMYSGLNEDDVLLGDGTVVDLSETGVGIRGNRHVTVGMELTLFLYLPDESDPLFILEGTVVWSSGSQFGVVLNELSLQEGDRMRVFLHAKSIGQA